MTTTYNVISPDGFPIHYSDTYTTKEAAQKALENWIKNYETQGYYSANGGRIPLADLPLYCSIETEQAWHYFSFNDEFLPVEGQDTDNTWNGHSCPLFPASSAVLIAQHLGLGDTFSKIDAAAILADIAAGADPLPIGSFAYTWQRYDIDETTANLIEKIRDTHFLWMRNHQPKGEAMTLILDETAAKSLRNDTAHRVSVSIGSTIVEDFYFFDDREQIIEAMKFVEDFGIDIDY